MLSLTGCIVADPPEYEEPRRTPPILDLNRAEPSPYWLVIVDRDLSLPQTSRVQIKVPLRSDDQGEQVWWAVHIDYKGNGVPLSFGREQPSTLDDTSRSISAEVVIDPQRVDQGCHQLTLLVAHDSSWNVSAQEPYVDAPKEDIAIGTWWMNVDPPLDPFTLSGCPNQSEVDK